MEYIFEFILELILESSVEVSKNNKISKYIRYPLIALIILFFIAAIGLIFFIGVLLLKENLIAGIFFVGIALFMLISGIIKFRKTYLVKSDQIIE